MTTLTAFFPTTGPIESKPQVQEAPAVRQTVSVEAIPSRSDLTSESSQWTWQELRDYVCAQIIQTHGPFPRDAKKEFGIFTRFHKAHGQDGVKVARAAFEIYGGWWNNAPISINRFTKGSDPYFVEPILARLSQQ